MIGNLSAESFATTKKNPSDDVQSTALPGQIAPRLQDLGDHKFLVTTNSARAQLFINQAMMLVYGFNHAEAIRSFRETARLDPNCAMAYWGMALALGPNINMEMAPEAGPQAYGLIQKAMSMKENTSEKEQALLEDNLIYNEPPDWHIPVRQSLGAVLLDAGRAAEAEAIYWQDLRQNRENGWSLFGLMQSLRDQGKDEQAVLVEKRFLKAWQGADVSLTASRFMGDMQTTMAAADSAVSGN